MVSFSSYQTKDTINIANLVGVCKTAHTTHDAEDVVVSCVDTNLGCLCALNSVVGKNKLKCCVVDAREVASAGWLVLFWAKRE